MDEMAHSKPTVIDMVRIVLRDCDNGVGSCSQLGQMGLHDPLIKLKSSLQTSAMVELAPAVC